MAEFGYLHSEGSIIVKFHCHMFNIVSTTQGMLSLKSHISELEFLLQTNNY